MNEDVMKEVASAIILNDALKEAKETAEKEMQKDLDELKYILSDIKINKSIKSKRLAARIVGSGKVVDIIDALAEKSGPVTGVDIYSRLMNII